MEEKKKFAELDPGRMAGLLEDFPAQLPRGREIAKAADLSSIDTSIVKNIVVCGMGGSAIGGDLIRAYALEELAVPMIINRDYRLPSFVGGSSLVIGSSYSGNTEETLDSFTEAGKRGAQRIVITTGGRIAGIAEAEKIPKIVIPPGLPPRAALGYSFSPMLTLLESFGFIPDQQKAMDETYDILLQGVERYNTEAPEEENAAKNLGRRLFQKLPLIYSDDWHFNSVAVRFRGQINENAKQLAYTAFLPENNHNELVGWKKLGPLGDIAVAVWLTDCEMHPRVAFRADFMRKVQKDCGVDTIEMRSVGESLLARMFSLIQFGDWASYYMAIFNGENPTPVAAIDRLKAALKEFGN